MPIQEKDDHGSLPPLNFMHRVVCAFPKLRTQGGELGESHLISCDNTPPARSPVLPAALLEEQEVSVVHPHLTDVETESQAELPQWVSDDQGFTTSLQAAPSSSPRDFLLAPVLIQEWREETG